MPCGFDYDFIDFLASLRSMLKTYTIEALVTFSVILTY